MGDWLIHLSGWIIQDGNYPDFSRGQHAEFAVEYWWDDGPRVTTATKSEAYSLDVAKYSVNARVHTVPEDVSVLDIGLLVFHEEASPHPTEAGAVLEGQLGLGVDPFFYFERLAKDPRLPDLVYSWEILRIERDMTPWRQEGRVWVRDASMARWADVDVTDARHEQASVEYVLHCRRRDIPPKRESSSSTNWIARHRRGKAGG
jgi:hypothetical protein